MPSLGMLTINALAAADSVLIPVQTEYLSTKGLGQLMQTTAKVRRHINPALTVSGVLLTMPETVLPTLSKYYLANKPEDSDWVVLPVANFNAYFGTTSFGRKWIAKLSESVMERKNGFACADIGYSYSKMIIRRKKCDFISHYR